MERKEGRNWTRRAIEARERDMRLEGAGFGRAADAREQLVDLAVQRGERREWLDRGPNDMRAPLPLEQSDPGEARGDGGRMQAAQRRGNIFGAVVVDFADKAQCQVKLVVVLPARRRNAVHCSEQLLADDARRPQRDEETVGRHDWTSISAPAVDIIAFGAHFCAGKPCHAFDLLNSQARPVRFHLKQGMKMPILRLRPVWAGR
jgi:hypothetical protein